MFDRRPRAGCRSCGNGPLHAFLSLGDLPLPDRLIDADKARDPEPRFSLDVAFCPDCSLVQLLDEVSPQLLFVDNYLYFSSYADDLLAHAQEHAFGLIDDRGLGRDDLVVEIGSNDGYLLRNFVERDVPVLGIDPAPHQVEAARSAGVPTLAGFFDASLARQLRERGLLANVIIANNVMAHVPNPNGFVEGVALLLAEDGIVTIENPWVRDLIDHCEFDTIYHEHFCYFSCHSVQRLANRHGLHLNQVDYFPDLHGGTLRWTLGKRDDPDASVTAHLDEEQEHGLTRLDCYSGFAMRVAENQRRLRELLIELKEGGARIAAYGAAAKGSVLLNATHICGELIDYVVDRNPHKQGKLMPGVHVPILAPEKLLEDHPDYVLLLAWNFSREIMAQQVDYVDAGGRFIVPIPEPTILA
ncbi:MAG: class I SAM-dependent methyltransferase [Gemmatimonadota bacterium]